LKILEAGQPSDIVIGSIKKVNEILHLVVFKQNFAFNCELGWDNKTYSYNAADRQIFMKQQERFTFGPKCKKCDADSNEGEQIFFFGLVTDCAHIYTFKEEKYNPTFADAIREL